MASRDVLESDVNPTLSVLHIQDSLIGIEAPSPPVLLDIDERRVWSDIIYIILPVNMRDEAYEGIRIHAIDVHSYLVM